MNKKLMIASMLGAIALTAVSSTYAFGGQKQGSGQLDETVRTAIHEAVVGADYASFKTAVVGTSLANINEETFEKFVEKGGMQFESRGGKLGFGEMMRFEVHQMRKAEAEERRIEMDKIMEAKDYSAWLEVAPAHMKEAVNSEAKFEKLLEMHEHMEAARSIREKLEL